MSSNRLVNDQREVDNTIQINDTARYYAELALTEIYKVLGEFYPLIIRPVGNGFAGFFKGEDGNYRLYQPIADAAMIPGNAAMVLADGFAPLHPNGGLGLPTAPIFGRLIHTGQLLQDLWKPQSYKQHTIKGPIAAIVASSLAVYVGLQCMAVTNGLLFSNHSLASQLTFNPVTIVENLLHGDPTLFQKLIIGVSGYIGATNAYVKGRDLVQNDLQQWWQDLWADVKKDHLLRHLQALEKITDPAVAKRVQEDYHRVVAAGNNYSLIDVSGRSLERLLSVPSQLFSFPSHNTRELTLPKAWLKNNSYVRGGVEAVQIGGNYISQYTPPVVKQSVEMLVNFLGWDYQQQSVKPDVYPTYADLMATKMTEYWSTPYPVSVVVNLWAEANRLPAQRKLDEDLISQYTQAIYNYSTQQPLNPPLMPKSWTLLPLNDNWSQMALANGAIVSMLRGVFEFPATHTTLRDKARFYNEALYSVYSTGNFNNYTVEPRLAAPSAS